ncbi:ESCRT-I complex subunit VPS23 [Intoshia linei]|uniref:ESCRT-I complex subunit VPS23 n=1 Tax=Intoshia linei TaxID=1819745 RepID=A0A177BCY3_9BILA|nr:ESCRT-I complex subunit VPS23 [Intoshia linei]
MFTKINSPSISREKYIVDELNGIVAIYPTLSYKTEPYGGTMGCFDNLYIVTGTFNINYGGNKYDVPIRITLPIKYPYIAPIVNIIPSRGTYLNVSEFLDANGNVTLPCLSRKWAPHKVTLLSLLDILRESFSSIPPLYLDKRKNIDTKPNDGSIDSIRASLLSAIADKCNALYKTTYDTYMNTYVQLQSEERQLLDGQQRLLAYCNQIEDETNKVKQENERLSAKNKELDSKISNFRKDILTKNDENLNYEEAVKPQTPFFKQLLDATAEEQSICDVLHLLKDSYENSGLSIYDYLKKVREYSKKRYFLRHTIKKCRARL